MLLANALLIFFFFSEIGEVHFFGGFSRGDGCFLCGFLFGRVFSFSTGSEIILESVHLSEFCTLHSRRAK